MEARRCPSSLKQRVWFSPYLLAVALMPAFIQIDYSGCFYYGDSRLSELELIVEGENRITGFDSDQRSYDVVLPWDTTEAQVRTVSNDPEARVWVFVLIDGERTTYLDDGHGGSDIVVPLSPGSSVLQVAVAPHGRATDFYEVAIEIGIDLCAGADCDDGNDCTADICDPADGSCTNDLLPEGTLCGVDGVCDAGACRERSWGAPVLLETNDADAGSPQLEMNAQGDAVAVWEQAINPSFAGAVWANRFTSGMWGTAEVIGGSPRPGAQPRLALNPSGDAVVVWVAYGGQAVRLVGANRLTSGIWDGGQAITSNGISYPLQVAMDAQGNAIALYSNSISRDVESSRSTASGVWSSLGPVDPDGSTTFTIQLVMDAPGNALAFWPGTGGIWFSRAALAGGWSPKELLESDGPSELQVESDGEGNALLFGPQGDDLWTIQSTSGVWGSAERTEVDGLGDTVSPQFALDTQGNGVVVWLQSDGVQTNVWANWTTSGVWGTAELLETNDMGDAFAPKVAMASQGNAMVVWQQSDGVRESIWANRLTSGVWGTAQLIELDDAGDAAAPHVGIDAQGNAIAAWQQSDGIRTNIWANRYE